MIKGALFSILSQLLLPVFLLAADLRPVARISKDSFRLGEPFTISLHADYPAGLQILFPDSNYIFPNCILKKRRFFPTRTRNGISRDCVSFELACFAPGTTMRLQLPVVDFNNGDSIRYLSNGLQFRTLKEKIQLKENKPVFLEETNPEPIALKLNYPYLLTGLTLFFLVLLILNFFFDKPIQKFFSLWLEGRRYRRFTSAFLKMQENLERDLSVPGMEALIILWKRYLQRVEGKPFLTFTSREISRELADPEFKKTLEEIDRWIYGGLAVKDIRNCTDKLKLKSSELYEKKRNLIRNGKAG